MNRKFLAIALAIAMLATGLVALPAQAGTEFELEGIVLRVVPIGDTILLNISGTRVIVDEDTTIIGRLRRGAEVEVTGEIIGGRLLAETILVQRNIDLEDILDLDEIFEVEDEDIDLEDILDLEDEDEDIDLEDLLDLRRVIRDRDEDLDLEDILDLDELFEDREREREEDDD